MQHVVLKLSVNNSKRTSILMNKILTKKTDFKDWTKLKLDHKGSNSLQIKKEPRSNKHFNVNLLFLNRLKNQRSHLESHIKI